MASSKSDEDVICLEELLSSCIDASLRGCNVIRRYKKNNETVSGNLKEVGEVKSVVTQADIDAQDAIISGLRSMWGEKMEIVGEEDDNEDQPTESSEEKTPLRCSLLDGTLSSKTMVPMRDITLFVDPLDGTREFVEGRVQNVGCLIGVARKGKAIMGAVGLPFPTGISSPEAKILYAIAMDDDITTLNVKGAYPAEKKDTKQSESPKAITVFTGDSKDPVLKNATNLALKLAADSPSPDGKRAKPIHTILGGTTSKLVACAQNERSIAVLHFKTCYWDTCAPEPLLKADGGKVTDFFGSPLVHKPDKRYNYGNLWGVVVSSKGMEDVHDALCAGMRADMESVQLAMKPCVGRIPESAAGPQALDIARDLDGHPLTKDWLQDHILQHQPQDNKNWSLKGFGIPESDAVRGLMSNGARLVLDWVPTVEAKKSLPAPPSTVFYKRVVMSDLSHARAKLDTAPHKVLRDVHSYQVETDFLDSRACQEGLIHEAGAHVCDCYGASKELAGGETPREQLESKFCMTLEDFNEKDGWYQEWLLEEESCKAALKNFANMHAYYWTGSNFWKKENGKLGKLLEASVWPNGGYMQPALQGYGQLDTVAAGWTKRLPSFLDDLKKIPELKGVTLEEIGARVEKLASYAGMRAHPYAEKAREETTDLQKYRTLIHGDPKQSNIFFRRDGSSGEIQVGLIDFQWCGFGLAATDIAHHITAALQPHCLSYDGEKEKILLDYYYSCLTDALVKYGVAVSEKDVHENIFPRQVLQDQYEIAFLDICRMVFAYAWSRWKPESAPSASSFNRNSYNKSLDSVLWFITRCSGLLASVENKK